MGGLPANAPERPAVRAAVSAVHDTPSPRAQYLILTEEERRKAEEDLVSRPRAASPAATPMAKSAPAKGEKERPGAKRGAHDKQGLTLVHSARTGPVARHVGERMTTHG